MKLTEVHEGTTTLYLISTAVRDEHDPWYCKVNALPVHQPLPPVATGIKDFGKN